jgi:hypothetical protein
MDVDISNGIVGYDAGCKYWGGKLRSSERNKSIHSQEATGRVLQVSEITGY